MLPLDPKDQDQMEQRIRAAFRGVSRAGGVSWSEADVIDDWGSEEECAAARAKDTERSWEELVDDPRWEPYAGVGGFNFLDAIGFRYYLAPALIRSVRSGLDEGILFHLTRPRREGYPARMLGVAVGPAGRTTAGVRGGVHPLHDPGLGAAGVG